MYKDHILITGASGFVGGHLASRLIAMGYRVSMVVRSNLRIKHLSADYCLIDLQDHAKVADLINSLRPDYVIHLASSKNRCSDLDTFQEIYDENVSNALNVIRPCLWLRDFKRFIFLGSCDEYGSSSAPYEECQFESPVTAYGLSKLAITKILAALYRAYNFPFVALRPSVIYGPGQGDEMFIPSLIKSLLEKKIFLMTEGEQTRDFIYITDVVDVIIKTLVVSENVNGRIFNIGSGASHKIKDVAALVANLVGSDALRLINYGALNYRDNEVMHYSLNIDLAKNFFEWDPVVDMRDGIQGTINYMKNLTN